MARDNQDSVLRFECDSCGTHLGVDDSLAGLEAPCPKCGKLLVAPEIEGLENRIPSSGVTRGVSGGAGFQADPRSGRASFESDEGGASSGRRRKVYPTSGRMPNEDEKDNLKVLIRIAIATFLVVLVVILVVWYLKNH